MVTFAALQVGRPSTALEQPQPRGQDTIELLALAVGLWGGLFGGYLALTTSLGQNLSRWIVIQPGRIATSIIISVFSLVILDSIGCWLRAKRPR